MNQTHNLNIISDCANFYYLHVFKWSKLNFTCKKKVIKKRELNEIIKKNDDINREKR